MKYAILGAMNFLVTVYFEFICLMFSLTLYFRRGIPLYLKLFPPFLVITLVIEIVRWILKGKGVDTSLMYFLFIAFEFVLYLYMLYLIIRRTRAKKIILSMAFIYPVLALLSIFIFEVNVFPSISYSIGCLLIVGVCIYYFFELFRYPSSISLLREPAFWICTGLLFFYICSFPLFGLYRLLYSASSTIMNNISTILDVMNVFLYTFFTTAFLCGIRIRKLLYR